MELILSVSLIYDLVLFIPGWIMWRFPPRKINWFYGFRTARSMKSAETWTYANRRCGRLFMMLSAVFLGILLLSCLALWAFGMPAEDPETLLLFPTGLLLFFIFLPILIVEKELKRKFDGDGHPLEPPASAD